MATNGFYREGKWVDTGPDLKWVNPNMKLEDVMANTCKNIYPGMKRSKEEIVILEKILDNAMRI